MRLTHLSLLLHLVAQENSRFHSLRTFAIGYLASSGGAPSKENVPKNHLLMLLLLITFMLLNVQSGIIDLRVCGILYVCVCSSQ